MNAGNHEHNDIATLLGHAHTCAKIRTAAQRHQRTARMYRCTQTHTITITPSLPLADVIKIKIGARRKENSAEVIVVSGAWPRASATQPTGMRTVEPAGCFKGGTALHQPPGNLQNADSTSATKSGSGVTARTMEPATSAAARKIDGFKVDLAREAAVP